MKSRVNSGRVGLARLSVALAALAWGVVHGDTTTESSHAPGAAAAQQAPRHPSRQSLDDRVAIYTRELNLDETQQSELRQVLESQREQISRLWNDTAVPAGNRVLETRMIMDSTEDRIRALLNEEQRKKYNAPRQPHPAQPAPGERSVEEWMEATRQQQQAPSP